MYIIVGIGWAIVLNDFILDFYACIVLLIIDFKMATQATPGATTESDIGTFREFLKQYNNVTEKCFGACISDFTSRFVLKNIFTISNRNCYC